MRFVDPDFTEQHGLRGFLRPVIDSGRHAVVVCLGGSHAYGLADEHSDLDLRGILLQPTREILGLEKQEKTFTRKDPDMVLWEIGHFLSMAVKCNPNALELLWLPVICHMRIAEEVFTRRASFLSQRIRTTYTGYALGEMKHAQRHLDGIDQMGPEQAAQHEHRARRKLLHVFRILTFGDELLRFGEIRSIPMNVSRVEEFRAMPLGEAFFVLDGLHDRVANAPSDLPDEPDRWEISMWLAGLRLQVMHDIDALSIGAKERA